MKNTDDIVSIETGYHEAGHVVIGCITGRIPVFATVVRYGNAAGQTVFEGSDYSPTYLDKSPAKKRYVRQLVLEKLAGSAALDLYNPTRVHDTSDKHDLRVARQFVEDFVSWEDEETYFAKARSEVIALIQQNWHSVQLVAQALLEHDILQRDELLALCPAAVGA